MLVLLIVEAKSKISTRFWNTDIVVNDINLCCWLWLSTEGNVILE